MIFRQKLQNLKGQLRGTPVLAFLPIATVGAFWVGNEVVLFVVGFLFPALVLWQSGPQQKTDNPEFRDELTGLPSRLGILKHLDQFLDGPINQGRETAVLHIKIDRFKTIGMRFGPAAEGRVLKAVSIRIQENLRHNDLMGRLGHDEFAVVLFPIKKTDLSIISAIADRIHAAFIGPIFLGESECQVTCSIGVCLSARAPELTAQSILSAAEEALCKSLSNGPGMTGSFSPAMRRSARVLKGLSDDLGQAFANNEIRPYFQPQICLETGKLLGFEALARWIKPNNSVVLPGDFLNAVEAAGLSAQLGDVFLTDTLKALELWGRKKLNVLSVGVNFTASELSENGLVEKIKWDVDRFDLSPSRVSVEVLENVISDHDGGRITKKHPRLGSAGVWHRS